MATIIAEELRYETLRRQFPDLADARSGGAGSGDAGAGDAGAGDDAQRPGRTAALELMERLGPVQSQVPRSPFLTLSSRLPGVRHATVCALFEEQLLLKTTNLRGTVHTSGRTPFGWLDAVATVQRDRSVQNALGLVSLAAADVDQEVRRFCSGAWRPRAEVVTHTRDWLGEREPAAAARLSGTFAESVVWGNSGVLRRPRDRHWEKRTDAFHRTAVDLVPGLARGTPAEALAALVPRHLAAHGPVTRADLAFFFGAGLGSVDRAVDALGERVVRLQGPDHETFLDLAEPPVGGTADPGCRLLGEFDALLLGFHGRGRTRFLTAEQLERVWARTNGIFSPVVLHDGRLVGTWRTRTQGRRVDLEVTPFDRGILSDDVLAPAVAPVEQVLGITVGELRLLPPGVG